MRRRPQEGNRAAITFQKPLPSSGRNTGLVLSGGGARAAYQVGALKALVKYFEGPNPEKITVITGSSIGAINGLCVGAGLKHGLGSIVDQLDEMWRMRNFRNTFRGTPSQAFFRAIKMAVLQYMAPGPNPTSAAIFDPTPLMDQIDKMITSNGGLGPDERDPGLLAVGVMTTMEGKERKPLLFLSTHKPVEKEVIEGASFEVCYVKELTAKHGFASAALPSVLPPVELDVEGGKITLVDGGISQNIPVDPAVRLGADHIVVVDVSGRDWWLDRYNESHDTRPTWEVPAALKTFCLRPPETFVCRCHSGVGDLLKHAVSGSRSKFMAALGPVWPVFQLLKRKLGEEVAFEAMSYVALDEDYIAGLIERGYNETLMSLRNKSEISFTRSESYETWIQQI